MAAKLKPIAATRLDEHGQITIPARFRRALGLEKDSDVLVIRVGEALMIVPQDRWLEQFSERLRAALKEKGVTVAEFVAGLTNTRKELFKELHPDIDL